MNQPVRVIPGKIQTQVGTPMNQISMSPALRRKLRPLPDGGLVRKTPFQESPTRKKLNIQSKVDSPSTQESSKEMPQVEFIRKYSDSSSKDSPIIKTESSTYQSNNSPFEDNQKFFHKSLNPNKSEDKIRLPSLKDTSLSNLGKKSKLLAKNTPESSSPFQQTKYSVSTFFKPKEMEVARNQSRAALRTDADQGSPSRPPSGSHLRSASNPVQSKNGDDVGAEKEKSSIVSLVSMKSKAGTTGKNKTKTNQDSIFYFNNFCGEADRNIFGVCDGHGTYGHFVSQFAKKILPLYMETTIKQNVQHEMSLKEEPYVLKSFSQTFTKVSKEIQQCGLDVTYSGTTCVTVIMQGKNVWCANIGDSRAVLYFLKDGLWNIQPLSNDHKPDLPTEKRRILKANGRVEPFYGQDGYPVGPSRVWLKHEQAPGLAMSRSFGDYVASTVGVISEPEVTYFNVNFEWGFLVVASDGVWEFMSNERVCELLQSEPHENFTSQSMENLANLIVNVQKLNILLGIDSSVAGRG